MVETTTLHYNWTKPEITKSASTWGGFLNTDLDSIDALVFANQQGIVPIGAITMFSGATAPANWLICDGSTLAHSTGGAYEALFAVIGYTYGGSGANFNLPNLSQRFPLGASGGTLGAAGGEAAHVLVAGEMPAHAHSITDVAHNHGVNQWYHDHSYSQTPHAHGVTDPTHTHSTSPYGQGLWTHAGAGAVTGTYPGASMADGTIAYAATGISIQAQYANINFAGVTSSVSLNASGTGLSTTNNNGGGAAHNNLPPYVQINFIIRFQ